MRDFLLLRLDAPLMSFGGPMVDKYGVIQAFPAQSLVTGLLANALGYEHREAEKLQRLQQRLCVGARADMPGRRLTDFQTIDLGQPFLSEEWTTRGAVEGRAGASSEGTHIRERDYLADAVYTLAVTLDPADEAPTLDDLRAALDEPERPLFLGRKTCLPSSPLLAGRCSAENVYEALSHPVLPKDPRVEGETFQAWWPAESDEYQDAARLLAVNDERDWQNQIHVGRRMLRHGPVTVREAPHGR